MEQTGGCQRGGRLGDWMKEGEGTKQKTILNTRSQTTVWQQPERKWGRGWVEVGKGGKLGLEGTLLGRWAHGAVCR